MNQFLSLSFFGEGVIKGLSYLLDKFVYLLARTAFEVFCFISEITLENQEIITGITSRIYAILGIFLVFVLSYNLLTYIVDPDKLTDNKKGASAIIKDVVIALVIIAITPTLFVKLYAFQNTIITSGVISNLILGGYSEENMLEYGNTKEVGRNYIKKGANNMAANVFTTFLYPADSDFSVLDCPSSSDSADSSSTEYLEYCQAYANMISTGAVSSFSSLYDNQNYTYMFFLSTVGGIILAFFMFSFCLNLAKRVFKLIILQLIAPVPVVMELIPSKSGTRQNWINTTIQVYLEVFMYQAVIFIIIYLVSLIPGLIRGIFSASGNVPVGGFTKMLAMVFLIVGLLQFAKEAPKMIFDLLGIKSTGVIADAAKRALKLPGIGLGAIGTGATSLTRGIYNTVTNTKNTKGIADKIGAAVGGGIGALTAGIGGIGYGGYANRSGSLRNLRRNTSGAINTMQNVGNRVARPVSKGVSGIPGVPGAMIRGFNAYGEAVGNFVSRAYTDGPRKAFAPIVESGSQSPVGKRIKNWATGNKTGDVALQAANRFSFSSKIKPNDDDAIKGYRKQLQEIFMNAGVSYDSFKRKSDEWREAHKDAKGNKPSLKKYLYSPEADGFIRDPEFRSVLTKQGDIIAIQDMLDKRQDALKVDSPKKLDTDIANLKALMEREKSVADMVAAAEVNMDKLNIDPMAPTTTYQQKLEAYAEIDRFVKYRDEQQRLADKENAARNLSRDKDK